MSKLRSIEMSFKGPGTHFVGDGFKVSQYFPLGKNLQECFSLFILLDYNKPHHFEASNVRRGVGAHPHRWLETVTIAYDGSVEHHDNKGNHGIIGAGDVQWMTAGSGVLHKEYHEKEFSKMVEFFTWYNFGLIYQRSIKWRNQSINQFQNKK